MSIVNYKTFNLDERRPKVLLIGNGLTYSTGIPWAKLIQRTAKPGADIAKYEKHDESGRPAGFHVPNTILMLAVSDVGDGERHARYVEALDQKSYPENARLKELLSIPFDAVLTTNYTYELEASLLPRYPGLSKATKRRYARVIDGKQDARFLLHTFNRIGDGSDIWHIHGELRRPARWSSRTTSTPGWSTRSWRTTRACATAT